MLSLLTEAFANEEENSANIASRITQLSTTFIVITSIIVIVLVSISVLYEKKVKKYKKLLFLSIIIPIILTSLFIITSTIYLNVISETKGPVHWHADFEIWDCDKKIDIIDPTGLSNRIGTPVFHEHGDNRIHVEGVVVKKRNVDLHSFFEVINGELTENSFSIPMNNNILKINDEQLCNGKPGKLQVFVYSTVNSTHGQQIDLIYKQEKIEAFTDYVLSPFMNVPPGDCIIIEFAEEKSQTDKICETYKIAIQEGKMKQWQ